MSSAHPEIRCDLYSDLRLLWHRRDVPVDTPGQFVVSLGNAVSSYEPLEKVVYGEVVVDLRA